MALFVIIGGLIIAGLASYAAYLLLQVRKQKQLKQQVLDIAVAKRNANIFDNIYTFCMVGIQGQCDLSELSIRICSMLEFVQWDHEKQQIYRIDLEADYPALCNLYHQVKDMARGDARSELTKQQKKEQEKTRIAAEQSLSSAIIEELKQLQQRAEILRVEPKDLVTAVKKKR